MLCFAVIFVFVVHVLDAKSLSKRKNRFWIPWRSLKMYFHLLMTSTYKKTPIYFLIGNSDVFISIIHNYIVCKVHTKKYFRKKALVFSWGSLDRHFQLYIYDATKTAVVKNDFNIQLQICNYLLILYFAILGLFVKPIRKKIFANTPFVASLNGF